MRNIYIYIYIYIYTYIYIYSHFKSELSSKCTRSEREKVKDLFKQLNEKNILLIYSIVSILPLTFLPHIISVGI
jgi:beta-lactamase regulating signal transducer with metallopeptidase domain